MNYSKVSTYVGAFGLICLALYYVTVKDFEAASNSFFSALGVLGLRRSVVKVKNNVNAMSTPAEPPPPS